MLFPNEEQMAVRVNQREAWGRHQDHLAGLYGTGPMIGNALTLPYDVWKQWDREGIMLNRDVLAVFNSLAASVTRAIPVGKTLNMWHTISGQGAAQVSMDGRHTRMTDAQVISYNQTAIPLITDQFSYGWRQVEAAQSEGYQLDAAGRINSNRNVAETLELAVLDGYSAITVGGVPSYGLRTHPSRNTRSTGVTLNGATGAQWVAEITACIQALLADNFYSPVTIYLNYTDWFYAGATEYTAGYPKKIITALMEIPNVREIIPASRLAADEIIGLIKEPTTVQLLSAMPIATAPLFRANVTDEYVFQTMAGAAVQVMFDSAGQCGVIHST